MPQQPVQPAAPGDECDRLCERLVGDLSALVNPKTGAPIVTEATMTSDVYDGPMRSSLPDILLNWDNSAPIRAVTLPSLGTVENRHKRARTGDHGHEFGGLFVVGDRACNRLDEAPIDVTAVAPTIMQSLGVATSGMPTAPVDDLVRAMTASDSVPS